MIRTRYDDRRVQSAEIPNTRIDPRLEIYAARVGQDAASLVATGVTVVECTCRMTGCPGWTAKWPHDNS